MNPQKEACPREGAASVCLLCLPVHRSTVALKSQGGPRGVGLLWALPPLPCCSWLQICDPPASGAQEARAQRAGVQGISWGPGAGRVLPRVPPSACEGAPPLHREGPRQPPFGGRFLFPAPVPRDMEHMGPGPPKAHPNSLTNACLPVAGVSRGLGLPECVQFRSEMLRL